VISFRNLTGICFLFMAAKLAKFGAVVAIEPHAFLHTGSALVNVLTRDLPRHNHLIRI